MSSYFVVHIENLTHSAEEWLSHEVFEFGASGMSEVLGFRQPEGEEEVFTQITDQRAVDVYFAAPPNQDFLKLLAERLPAAKVIVRTEVEKDWLAEWKKGFKPFALTADHWVIPSWCEAPPEAKHRILIDPGMAFGTGTHETTQLVAREMVRLFGHHAQSGLLGGDWSSSHDLPIEVFQRSLLDVGTGTGILAILAAQLGFKKIHATELDSEARRVSKENFAINHTTHIRIDDRQIEDLNEKYDVVVANIIDGVLVRIQDQLKAKVKPGGWLIVSGIITEREAEFLNGFVLPEGATWEPRVQHGDWLLYSVRLGRSEPQVSEIRH